MLALGWEYAILLKDEDYFNSLQHIFNALKEAQPKVKIVIDENGLSVLGDDEKWPEVLEIKIDIANNIEYIIPNGKKYFYCLFHVDGNIAVDYIDCIKKCMDSNGYKYIMKEF